MKIIKDILKAKTIYDVEQLVKDDRYSIIVKSFAYELVILTIFQEDNLLNFRTVYFDLKQKEYIIEHHSILQNNDFPENFLFVDECNGLFRYHFKNGIQELKIFSTPKGHQYKINIQNGFSGGGGNWPKRQLGL